MRPASVVLSLLAIAAALVLMAGCEPRQPKPKPEPQPAMTPSPAPAELGVTVRVAGDSVRALPRQPEMSISAGSDHIRWLNETDITRTIHYKEAWPFMEPQGDIVLAPGAKSAWYTLDPGKLLPKGARGFPYEVVPSGLGPPDEPAISGQP